MFCFTNKSRIYFCSTISKWCTIFECNFCIIICPYNSNISCNQKVSIRIITKTLFWWACEAFYWIFVWIVTLCFTVNNVPFFVGNFEISFSELSNKFEIFVFPFLYDVYKFVKNFFWLIINFNPFLVTNLGKSLSPAIISSKSKIFWNSIFIQWNYILYSN